MKILCAIDGSRQSEWVLNWLPLLCAPERDELMLAHVVDITPYQNLSRLERKARAQLVEVLEFSLEGAVRLLESAEVKAARSWSRVRAKLLRGSPAEAIVRVAGRDKVDLLVVGSRGVTEFQPMLLGSVSRRVLAQSPCPVLVVKRPAKPLKRVVLGADGSIESWEAVSLFKQFPGTSRPAVTVASVIPPLPLESLRVPARALAVGDQVQGVLRREAQKLAARVAGTLRQARFPTKGMVLAGPPGAELVHLAGCERADLVVVGSRSRRSPREYFLGSVADTVVKHAPCSVLVYKG
jgi:nucleotide-binding universal stress UspA family protein